jgi:hypothetical protein
MAAPLISNDLAYFKRSFHSNGAYNGLPFTKDATDCWSIDVSRGGLFRNGKVRGREVTYDVLVLLQSSKVFDEALLRKAQKGVDKNVEKIQLSHS